MTKQAFDLFHVSSTTDGCFVHPHCLTCPLEYCIYDTSVIKAEKEKRNKVIIEMYNHGIGIAKIATQFSITTRQIARIVRKLY